jgi:hypothetical protein
MLFVLVCNDGHRHVFVIGRDQKAIPRDAWARFSEAANSLVLLDRFTMLAGQWSVHARDMTVAFDMGWIAAVRPDLVD